LRDADFFAGLLDVARRALAGGVEEADVDDGLAVVASPLRRAN
jgi:hypothetical protein